MEHEVKGRILSADRNRISEIKNFVFEMMSDLYPKGSYYENPHDLAFFEDVYLQSANARFFIAEEPNGNIIGTAAVKPYDRRFPEIEQVLGMGTVSEIVKFYIHPACRRRGIGSQLYAKAEQFAKEAGYAESYLHTSVYLPGGYTFWKSKNYIEQYWESEQIVHMSKKWTALS